MRRSRGTSTPTKAQSSRSIQTTLFSQGSSVSSIQESPYDKQPPHADAEVEDVETDNDGHQANTDDGYVSGGDASRKHRVLDANRASIFDYPEFITVRLFPYIGRNGEEKVKFGWRCNFCKKEFKDRNATKVICHLAGVTGNHIITCTGAIPEKFLNVIKGRNKRQIKKHSSNTKVKCEIDENILSQQQLILSGLVAMSEALAKGRSTLQDQYPEAHARMLQLHVIMSLTLLLATSYIQRAYPS